MNGVFLAFLSMAVKVHSHRTKAEAKAKIFFDVSRFSFFLVLLSFLLSLPLWLGVIGPLRIESVLL